MMFCMIMAMVDTPEDKKKVEALYKKYDRLMYYTAGKVLHRHEDIEDAVMEAWTRIIRNLDNISEISCPKTLSYVVIIVERTSIDIYNRNRKHGESEVPISDYGGINILNDVVGVRPSCLLYYMRGSFSSRRDEP